ncbi:MAG TPA: hypothetical protein VJ998_02395 [Pseudomonadales bacterium]|nr:hypothetical protein [Pseudomonadales bacterium]
MRIGVFALLASIIVLAPALDARAAPMPQPALTIAYYTTPANWLAFRHSIKDEFIPQLKGLKSSGMLSSYHVYFNRDVDGPNWNAMAVVEFKDAAGLSNWDARAEPAGLSQAALALTSSIETTRCDLVRHDSAWDVAKAPVTLVIPYKYLVSDDDYKQYLDGYTIPQLKGWIKAGILSRYAVLMDQYPAGRPWNAMLLLEYRSDAALARRDAVKTKVRTELANNPTWKAISERKQGIREELALTVADDATR